MFDQARDAVIGAIDIKSETSNAFGTDVQGAARNLFRSNPTAFFTKTTGYVTFPSLVRASANGRVYATTLAACSAPSAVRSWDSHRCNRLEMYS